MKLGIFYPLFLGAIIGLACVRIVSTYDDFWQTWDEPAHIACGLQWWEKGEYRYERFHPPLARIFLGAGPYLAGVRGLPGAKDHWMDGNAALHQGGLYERNLALARIGVLPFFVLALLIVAAWGRHCGGEGTSLSAVFIFSLLPPVLAHSGLATLDMACASLVAASIYALVLLKEKPDIGRAVFFGAASGLALAAKFSSAAFIVAGGAAVLSAGWITARPTEGVAGKLSSASKTTIVTAAVLAGSLALWAAYRFSFHPLVQEHAAPGELFQRILSQSGSLKPFLLAASKIPFPAPDFFWGLFDLLYFRRDEGHLVYFMGEVGKHGWLSFYPVVFLLKTPPAFLLLVLLGCFPLIAAVRAGKSDALALLSLALAVPAFFVVAVFATPHNGLRQILAVYPLLAVAAGSGAVWLWRSVRRPILSKCIALFLVAWCTASSYAAHPDYLAYFNFLAGSRPARIVNDSDLDWGQDLKRLSETCRRRGIDILHLAYNGSYGIDLQRFPLPPTAPLQTYTRQAGWIAISERMFYLGNGQAPYNQFAWLKREEPVEQVGHSILLYRTE